MMTGCHATPNKSPASAGLFYAEKGLLIVGAAIQPRSPVGMPVSFAAESRSHLHLAFY
jgi:hypothetical protein